MSKGRTCGRDGREKERQEMRRCASAAPGDEILITEIVIIRGDQTYSVSLKESTNMGLWSVELCIALRELHFYFSGAEKHYFVRDR